MWYSHAALSGKTWKQHTYQQCAATPTQRATERELQRWKDNEHPELLLPLESPAFHSSVIPRNIRCSQVVLIRILFYA